MGNFLDNNPIGGLVSAGVGAIDSIFGISQRRQENAQKRLMEQQQEYWNEQNETLYNQQVEQWNRENEYNDPTNAYKRLLDGAEANGLSKAQVLNGAGSQVQSQGASGVKMPGSTSLPSSSGAPLYSMGQGFMSAMRQVSELELMESQKRKTDSEAGYIDNKSVTEQLEWNIKATYDRVLEQSLSIGSRTIKEKDLNNKLISLRTEFQEIENKFANARNVAELDILESEYQKNFGIMDYYVSQTNRTDSLLPYEVNSLKAETALKFAYRKLADANANMTASEQRLFDQTYNDMARIVTYNAEMASWNAESSYQNSKHMELVNQTYKTDSFVRNFSSIVGSFTGAFTTAMPYLRPPKPKPLSKTETFKEFYDSDGVHRGTTRTVTHKK